MPYKKTKFNQKWLDNQLHPEFVSWLTEVKGKPTEAFCRICHCVIQLGNMGQQALMKHARGKKHNGLLEKKSSQISLPGFFGMKPVTKSQDQPSVGQKQVVTVSTIAEQCVSHSDRNANLDTFLLKDNVTKAEIIWAMDMVNNKESLNSCSTKTESFKLMFPDSAIASKFRMGRSKASYVINFGLAPHFNNVLHNSLQKVTSFVICFDESLNKVVQRGQMDLMIRFWDKNLQKVATRYLTSVFLGHATAKDLLIKFLEGTSSLPLSKLLQVSMDGPNVNLSFLTKLEEYISENGDNKSLLNLGVCGLHVVHGALKTGIKATEWDLMKLLRNMYFIFKDTPARRADFTLLTESKEFPIKCCIVRWVENVKCIERALLLYDNVMKYIDQAKLGNSQVAESLKDASKDKLMKCKLAFFKTIAAECEPFLRRFQTSKPLVPFLYEELHRLLRSLMSRCVKPDKLSDMTIAFHLASVDLKNTENLLPKDKVDVGFLVKKLLKDCKPIDKEKAVFLHQCQKMLITMIVKLLERSPLKYKIVRGLSSLDPNVVLLQPKLGVARMKIVLEVLHESRWITDSVAEIAKNEYNTLCKDAQVKFKNSFKKFVEDNSDSFGLDEFYVEILEGDKNYCNLWEIVKLCLVLSHGNASVESGFSINKALLVENLTEKSLVCQRLVFDGISAIGGVHSVPITAKMIQSVRASHRKYQDFMEEQKNKDAEKKRQAEEKKKIDEEIKSLESEKKKSHLEEASIDEQIQHLYKKRKLC